MAGQFYVVKAGSAHKIVPASAIPPGAIPVFGPADQQACKLAMARASGGLKNPRVSVSLGKFDTCYTRSATVIVAPYRKSWVWLTVTDFHLGRDVVSFQGDYKACVKKARRNNLIAHRGKEPWVLWTGPGDGGLTVYVAKPASAPQPMPKGRIIRWGNRSQVETEMDKLSSSLGNG